MSTSLASTSRPILSSLRPSSSPLLCRTVVHHARPTRVPVIPSPQSPKQPLPTSGTSHQRPSASPKALTSTQLENTNLTLHYAPPPSAPSYTTGAVPPFLRWIGGESVSLTGEEQAPKRRERRELEGTVEWDDAVVQRIKSLRAEGKSRQEIAKSLSIPLSQSHLISRVAPLSASQVVAKEQQLTEQKEKWGFRKTLARDVRERRKDFW